MSAAWKLNTTPVAALGVNSIRLQRSSQHPDECTLHVAAPFDSSPIFTHGATVTLYKDAVKYFVGRCDRDPRSVAGHDEHHDITLLGPWWYVQNRIYRQNWTRITDPTTTPPTTVTVPSTYVVLGMASDGSLMSSGAVIAEALNFCISTGAPFQLGTIMTGVQLPLDECNDITCAEVVHRCLRWTPDAVVWWDYSTAPYPTINIVRRGDLGVVSLPATAADGTVSVSAVRCAPCYSLLMEGVRLYFTVDSSAFPSVIQEAGTVTGFQVLESTVRLAGTKQTIILNKVEAFFISPDQNDMTFWQNNVPFLQGLDSLTLHDGNLRNTYDNQLISGTITDWMRDHQGIGADECIAEVQADYTVGGTEYKNQKITFKYTATNAESKNYVWGDGGTPAEVAPAGLAAAVYSACGTLHYEGSITVLDIDCGRAAAAIGHVLNLTGGLAAWASMRALITGTTEDLMNGSTVIAFGPPPCLSVGDMKALAQANRIRVPAGTAGAKKTGGQNNGASPVVGGTGGSNGAPSAGLPEFSKLQVTDPDDDTNIVTIDPADASGPKAVISDASYDGSNLVLTVQNQYRKGTVLVASDDTPDPITIPLALTTTGYTGTLTVLVPPLTTNLGAAQMTVTMVDLGFVNGLLMTVGTPYTTTDCLPPLPP